MILPKGYLMLWVGYENSLPSGWDMYDTEKDERNIMAKILDGESFNAHDTRLTKDLFRGDIDGKKTFLLIKQ